MGRSPPYGQSCRVAARRSAEQELARLDERTRHLEKQVDRIYAAGWGLVCAMLVSSVSVITILVK